LTAAGRHHVTRFAAGELRVPAAFADRSEGYCRSSHVDRSVGAVHTGFGTCQLESRAPLPPLHHSYRFNRDWDFLTDQIEPRR